MMKVLFLLFVYFINYVTPHSWIACSDYMEKNGAYWSASKCRGYPRDASRFAQKNSFGADRDFHHKPSNNRQACKTAYSLSSYSSAYPKAVYYPGQQVILVHPMKKHGADTCTNLYIPDKGNFIYRGERNTDRNRILSYYRSKVVANLGVSPTGYNARSVFRKYPKPGYQNAPAFCENTDKSMGTYAFNVPRNLRAGEYTFVWRWSFNRPNDIYITCFDVIIEANKAARDKVLSDRRMGLYVACGGVTSGNTAGSNVGCDGGSAPPSPPPEPTTTRAPVRITTRPRRTTSRPKRTTNRPRRTTTTVQTTTTTTPVPERPVKVNAYQISGEISLDRPRNGVTRRYLSVEFDCPGRINFLNARVTDKDDEKYLLLQEESAHLASQKIFFIALFDDPCDLVAYPPVASIDREE